MIIGHTCTLQQTSQLKAWKVSALWSQMQSIHNFAHSNPWMTGWWFQIFFIFIPTWGNDPIWLIFFKWAETTNQMSSYIIRGFQKVETPVAEWVDNPIFGWIMMTSKDLTPRWWSSKFFFFSEWPNFLQKFGGWWYMIEFSQNDNHNHR